MRLSASSIINKLAAVLICAVLSAIFVITLHFAAPKTRIVPETQPFEIDITNRIDNDAATFEYDSDNKIIAECGKDFTAVRIDDLTDLGKISKVNYVPDKFVHPGHLHKDIQIVDLTEKNDLAEKGTLIFIILNLDPSDADFIEKSESLFKYKIGDYWHFSIMLPEVFSASNVYLNTQLVAHSGEIENYDFTEFNTAYDRKTEKFVPKAARNQLDLSFYTRRQSLEVTLAVAQIITVHYQSHGGAYSGIMDTPLIGTENAIFGITDKSQNLLISFSILAIAVFAIFVVLSVLERTIKYLSSIVWTFGIALTLFANFMFRQPTAIPRLWLALALCSSFIILGGALYSVTENYDKPLIKFAIPAFALLGALLAFISPFTSFAADNVLNIICMVIKAVYAIALWIFIALSIVKKIDAAFLKSTCTTIIAVAVTSSLFMPHIFPAQYNPMFWLCIATTVTTFIGMFKIFRETKQANAYLTQNLYREVERQVKDIKTVIDERDNLLRFVSHDMKKPLLSSDTLLDTAIDREKDPEQIKTLKIIKQNNSRVVYNLSDIGSYAKFNYIAESPVVADLSELCGEICRFHTFDCNANGIVLKNLVGNNYNVFVKKQGLENAISNIILNAVEHAECSEITLSAKPDKNNIVLAISDNGKGMPSESDIFTPYKSSDDNSESEGIGLYICKNIIESMNGKLSYERQNGYTAFLISLSKA